nr:ROK family transcriptional regulator [uncultured Caproiciproducens sp.]
MNIKHTVDQTHIRSINQRVILDKIYSDEPISRAELARELFISKSAMTENIAALLNMGIIQEFGEGVSMSSGGRKPILLKFNKKYQYIIAIELNFEDPIFVLANLGGEILNKFTVNISDDSPYATRLDLVLNAVKLLLSSSNLTNEDLAIIAISCPGIFDSVNRTFFANSNFANWNMGDFSRQMEACFETSVLVVNDVNAAAVGEFTSGAGKNSRDLVYISGGLGLGAGIILNGEIYEGSSNCAGEIANEITIHNDMGSARGLSFKNLGGSTNINGLTARIRREAPESTRDAFAALGKILDKIGFKDIIRVWRDGDLYLKECVDDIAVIIGGTISNIVCLLNCDLVIFGGEYTVFHSQMLPIINRIVQENAFTPVEVIPALLEKNSGIYGLFALSKDVIFDKLCNQGHDRT